VTDSPSTTNVIVLADDSWPSSRSSATAGSAAVSSLASERDAADGRLDSHVAAAVREDGVDGDADEEQEAAEVQPRQDRRTVSDRISSPSRH
jgi:hypothetical protein